jgi:hypothetical protein
MKRFSMGSTSKKQCEFQPVDRFFFVICNFPREKHGIRRFETLLDEMQALSYISFIGMR